jgi:predicted transcriptional regulator
VVKNPNVPTQEAMAKKLNVSQSTICRIIHQDLNLVTRKKKKVHCLNDAHKEKRRVSSKKLLITHLQKQKMEFIVTLDEAWLYLSECKTGSDICYVGKDKEVTEDMVIEKRESYGVGNNDWKRNTSTD